MADFYPNEQGGLASPIRPINKPAESKLDVIEREYTLAAQTTSDVLRGLILPKGFKPLAHQLDPSVTLGSSTLAVGNAGTAGKYRAAATLTVPTALAAMATAGATAVLAADEEVLIAIGAATLPASGTLKVRFFGTYQ